MKLKAYLINFCKMLNLLKDKTLIIKRLSTFYSIFKRQHEKSIKTAPSRASLQHQAQQLSRASTTASNYSTFKNINKKIIKKVIIRRSFKIKPLGRYFLINENPF